MSNEVMSLDSVLPDYLKNIEVDEVTKSLMGSGGGNLKRISIRGSVWRLMQSGKELAKNEDRHLNVVVVNAAPKVSRAYYEQVYQEGGEASAPDCWSPDGDFPDKKAASPQASRCIDCPQNVAGSGANGTRACRYNRRIAVVLANDLKGDVYQLNLPATSVFGAGEQGKWPLEAYGRMLGSRNIPITAVVTEMRFDTNVANPKITFKAVGFLQSHEHEVAIQQGQTEAAKRAITMTVGEVDATKSKALPKAEVKAEVKVQTAPETKEEPPEPVKRTSKKNEEAAAGKPDLSKILAEWDD